jgi:hypothetical protein
MMANIGGFRLFAILKTKRLHQKDFLMSLVAQNIYKERPFRDFKNYKIMGFLLPIYAMHLMLKPSRKNFISNYTIGMNGHNARNLTSLFPIALIHPAMIGTISMNISFA